VSYCGVAREGSAVSGGDEPQKKVGQIKALKRSERGTDRYLRRDDTDLDSFFKVCGSL